jgi:hypothetical protein
MSAASKAIHSGGLRGAVRCAALNSPIVTRIRWWRASQYCGAGHGTVNAWFHADRVCSTGALKNFPRIADSGGRMHGRYCPEGGTQVFTRAEERPEPLGVRASTLDDPAIVAPAIVVRTARKPHWASLNPSIPHLAGRPGAIGWMAP